MNCVYKSYIWLNVFCDQVSFITLILDQKCSSLGGLEPPTFRLTAERASRLRHRDVAYQIPKEASIQFSAVSNI